MKTLPFNALLDFVAFGDKYNVDSINAARNIKFTEKLIPVKRFIDYGLQASGSCGPSQTRDWQYEYHNEKGIILVDRGGKVLGDRYFRGYYEGSGPNPAPHWPVLPGWTSMGRWSRWQE